MGHLSQGLRGYSANINESGLTIARLFFLLLFSWLILGCVFYYFTTWHNNPYFEYETGMAVENSTHLINDSISSALNSVLKILPGNNGLSFKENIHDFYLPNEYPNGTPEQFNDFQINQALANQGFFNILISNAYLSFFASFLLSAFFVTLVGVKAYKKGANANQKKILNNAQPLIEYEEAVKLSRKNDGDQYICKIRLPKGIELQHELMVGTTGSGKSTRILHKLDLIRKLKQPAVIYSLKPEYIAKYYRPGIDVILNPFDERSAIWGIEAEFTGSPSDFLKFRVLAESFITGKFSDEFWLNAPRSLFEEFARSLYVEGKLTTKKLADSLLKADYAQLRESLKNTYAASLVGKDTEKTTSNMLMTLVGALSGFRFLNLPCKKKFSISGWFESLKAKPDSWLFITPGNLTNLANARQLFTGWLDMCAHGGFDLGEDPTKRRRVHLVFDELDTLNNMPSVLNLLTKGRSYGLCVTVGIQNIAQAIDLYGDTGFRTMIGNCSTLLAYNTGNDQQSWTYMSDAFATIETEKIEETESYSPLDSTKNTITRSKSKDKSQVVEPHEFGNLPTGACFLRVNGMSPTKVQFKPYDKPNVVPDMIPRDMSVLYEEYRKNSPLILKPIQNPDSEDSAIVDSSTESEEDASSLSSTEDEDEQSSSGGRVFNDDQMMKLVSGLLDAGQGIDEICEMTGLPREDVINYQNSILVKDTSKAPPTSEVGELSATKEDQDRDI